MVKKKKVKSRPPGLVSAAKKTEEKPNLFERIYNRKKFNILGKKIKGEHKTLGRARSDAYDKVFI